MLCECVCVYCPLGFANVALPPLQQQHGTVSVFVVKLPPCVIVYYFVCTYVCVFWKKGYNNTFFIFEKRENFELNQLCVQMTSVFGC